MKFALETAAAKGGISAFLCWGKESELRALDRAAGRAQPLAIGDLGVAVLRGGDGAEIDEVMIGRPMSGFRILTAHGGIANAAAVAEMLKYLGGEQEAAERAPACLGRGGLEEDFNLLLPQCRTSTQAALILRARAGFVEKIRQIISAATAEAKLTIISELLQAWPKAQAILRPRRLCLAGPRNCGKSTLFNLLLGEPRALVSEYAGTTRDALAEWCDIAGFAVLLVDTAGFAADGTEVDAAAREQALSQIRAADTVAAILDATRPLSVQKEEIQPLIELRATLARGLPIVWLTLINKIDAGIVWHMPEVEALFPGAPVCAISCLESQTAHTVRQRLAELWGGIWQGEIAPVTQQQVDQLIALQRSCQG